MSTDGGWDDIEPILPAPAAAESAPAAVPPPPAPPPQEPPPSAERDAPAPRSARTGDSQHNPEAEMSVLGAMLLSEHAIADVCEIVRADDFYRGAHRLVFEVIVDLVNRNEPVDMVTVTDALERKGKLDDSVVAVVTEAVANTPAAAGAVHYAKIVADHGLRRRLDETGARIREWSKDRSQAPAEIMDRAEAEMFNLSISQRKAGTDFASLNTLLSSAVEQVEARMEDDGTITGLPTGFHDLDQALSGLHPENLIVLAARPSMGKSTLAVNVATHVAIELGKGVALFSLEMSEGEIMQRIISNYSKVDFTKLRSGELTDIDFARIATSVASLADKPLHIDDTPGNTLMDIRSKCRRLKQSEGLELIVVDYLQLMTTVGRVESRQQEVSAFSRGLKTLAKELEVPVIALSQLSRKPDERADRRPVLSDLRESGAIEQDADIIAFLYRDEVYNEDSDAKGEAELIIAKHRNGPLKTIHLAFQGAQSRFADMPSGAPQQGWGGEPTSRVAAPPPSGTPASVPL